MGTFIGHVYPGLFLLSYGLYQAIVVSKAVIVNENLLDPSCSPKNKGRWARLWEISYRGLLKMVTGSTLIAYEISCIKGGLREKEAGGEGGRERREGRKMWQFL